jgi:hypothetical protein
MVRWWNTYKLHAKGEEKLFSDSESIVVVFRNPYHGFNVLLAFQYLSVTIEEWEETNLANPMP